MTGADLLWMYPRAWRERYGEEFRAYVGDRRLSAGEWLDIVAGAIDARLSSEVRRVAASTAGGGGSMVNVLQALKARECGRSALSFRDSLVAAGVLVLGSLAIVALKVWVRSLGEPEAARSLANLGFAVLYIIVTNVWYLKGQPWRARVVLSTVLVAIFGLATWIASII